MALRNTTTHYGSIAKFFHWIVALFVIFLIILGFSMKDLSSPSVQSVLYGIHKSSGLTVLCLLILRYLWRLLSTTPKFASDMPVWQAKIANYSHKLLYLLIFIQPLSGWIMSTAAGHAPNFWWLIKAPFPWVSNSLRLASVMGYIHYYIAWIIVGAVSLHIIGALEHWIIRRDGVFQRMQPKFLKKKKRFYDDDE